MPRRKPLQTNFSAGELAPELGGRLDTEQYQNGAKSLLNRRCLIGGGTKRRPGSWHEAELVGASRIEPFIVDASTAYILSFSSGRVDAYSVDTVTGHLTAAGFLTEVVSGNDATTKVLLHFNGTDGSTTITDSNAGGAAHTWTARGNAQIDTATSVFGGASLLCDGTGDWVDTPDHADFALGSSDFTIQCWFNCTAPTGTVRGIAGQRDAGSSATSTSFAIYRENVFSNNPIVALVYVGVQIYSITSTKFYTNTTNPGWHHLAFVRTGNTLKLFIDGLQDGGDTTISGTVNNSAEILTVGASNAGGSNPWLGWLDDFVIDVGVARWTADFIPPSQSPGVAQPVPWTGDIWREMDYAQAANTAFITHPTMPPQKLVRTGASSWSLSALTFYSGAGGRTEQPYYRIADSTITLTPAPGTTSTDVGLSITVLANKPWFTADHVGSRIRIMQRELLITAFTSSTQVTASIVEQLRPTFRFAVNDSEGFAIDDIAAGATSQRKGVVAAIPDATHIDVIMMTQDQFNQSPQERIITANVDRLQNAASAQQNNAAAQDWDEQLFSAVNGYPACVTLHRNRLLFGGHPVVANALIGSKNTNLYSFDVGDASDGDGIFETIGDAGASSIVQLHSSEQLLVLTDLGPYYVPENATSPFRPTSIAFFPFGSPWSITATLEPKTFDDGVLFASKSLIIKARPSGDQSRLWAADEVSLLSTHIVSNPNDAAVVSNFAGGAERYAAMVNDDGTLAVLQLVEAQKIRNMTPWTTTGNYTSVAAIGSFLYATTERTINGSLRYFLELFDDAITLDLVTEYASQAAMDADVPTRYGSTTVNVVTSDLAYHLGEYPPTLSTLPTGPYQVGLYYDSVVELLPPVLDDAEGAHAGELRRICQAYVQVLQSARFEANGHELAAYAVTDPVDIAPPRRNGWQQFDLLGWAVDPTIAIRQPDPLPLDVLAVKTIVAY